MTKNNYTIAYVIFCALLTSCSSREIIEESYTPSREVVQTKADTPVVRVWDRWSERGQNELIVGGKSVVSSDELSTILANDPSPEVIAKLGSAGAWSNAGKATVSLAIATAITALVGYSKNDKTGERAFSIPVINTLWLSAGALAIFGSSSLRISANHLEDALTLHNARVLQSADNSTPHSLEIAIQVPL